LDQFDQSISAARKSINISPSFALGHMALGLALLFAGRASEAITPLEYGSQLSSYDPQNFVDSTCLRARLFSGRVKATLESAARALQVRQNWWTSLEAIVCCYAALEKWDEAHRYVQLMKSVKKPTGDVMAPLNAHNPVWAEQVAIALQKAGA